MPASEDPIGDASFLGLGSPPAMDDPALLAAGKPMDVVTWRLKDGLYIIEGMEDILPPVGPQTQRASRSLVLDEVVNLFSQFPAEALERASVERILEAYVAFSTQ